MGCSLITYLITEECQQCVCFGKGAGGCAGTTSHSAAHIKRLRRGGESWGAPASVPPLPWGEGVSFGLLAEGAGGVVVILTRSWKINRFPVMLWQLLPQPSSSSKWG